MSGGRKGGREAKREGKGDEICYEHSKCIHILLIYTLLVYSSRIRICHTARPRQFASLDKAGNVSTSQQLQSCYSNLNKSLFDTVEYILRSRRGKTTCVWSEVLSMASWTGPLLF